MTSSDSTEAVGLAPGDPGGAPRRGSASWALPNGAAIGERRVALEPLGGGERYEVYLAWDERLGARVVAKLLRPHLVGDDGALEGLRRETEVLAAVAHPALVRALGAALDGPRPHLVLELAEGPSLARLVKRHGVVPIDRLLPLGQRLAEALGALAASGFVHLDLKPAHVIAGAEPRLLGFSLARRVGAGVPPGDPLGSDAYLAPELCDPAASSAAVAPPADVFALGAVLHHALRGAPPFPRGRGAHGSADPALRFPQLELEPAALPERLPAPLRALLAATLARDPSARPEAAEVAAALGAIGRAVPTPRGRAAGARSRSHG